MKDLPWTGERVVTNTINETTIEHLHRYAFALEPVHNLFQPTRTKIKHRHVDEKFANAVNDLLGATVEVSKRNEIHTFAVIPKRWVVKRSFAWMEKCRRLWKNCERKINSSMQFVVLAFVAILLKRL